MNLRFLKILVIAMGVMLVVGIAALVATIAVRLSHRSPVLASARSIAAPSVELPHGARIEAIGVGAERIVVALVLADGGRQLLVLDISTGRKLVTIPLSEAK